VNIYTTQAEWDLDVFVPGQARPQGSKRSFGKGRGMTESSVHVGPWRERVALFAHQARVGQPLIERLVPVQTVIEFVLPRPKSAAKRSTPPMIRQPDLDKMLRAIDDALTGVVWSDDAQVTETHTMKRYAEIDETPGVRIRVATP
jgi:crossover junction endodeoxyribonuclease RusA